MADEIREHGYCALPGSLRSLIKTKRGKAVGLLLEELSQRLKFTEFSKGEVISNLKNKINGLRNEMQTLTDLTLVER